MIFKGIFVLVVSLALFFSLIGYVATDYLFSTPAEYQSAKQRLRSYTTAQYRTILEEGIILIQEQDYKKIGDKDIIRDSFPQELEFLDPEVIYVYNDGCRIFLLKVPGQGIGYSIRQETDGEWSISSFNEVVSWDHIKIDLEVSSEK